METQVEMNDFPWNVLLGLATCLCSDRVNENEPSEQGPMPDAGLSPDRPRGQTRGCTSCHSSYHVCIKRGG